MPKRAASPPLRSKFAAREGDTWGVARPGAEYLGHESKAMSIRFIEATSQKREQEYGAAFSKDGEMLFGKSGDNDSVQFNPAEMAKLFEKEGSIVTHNHPNSTSFSSADILFMFSAALSEMRISSREYTYSLSDPKGVLKAFRDSVKRQAYWPAVKPVGDKSPPVWANVGWNGKGVFKDMSSVMNALLDLTTADLKEEAEKRALADAAYYKDSPKEGAWEKVFRESYLMEISHLRIARFAEKMGLVYERRRSLENPNQRKQA